MDASVTAETPEVTVIAPDCRLLPFSCAVIAAVPGATAVAENIADDEPLCTVTDAGTVSTEVLLLETVTSMPPVGAAASTLTVTWTAPPTATFVALTATPDNAELLGLVGEFDPHCTPPKAENSKATLKKPVIRQRIRPHNPEPCHLSSKANLVRSQLVCGNASANQPPGAVKLSGLGARQNN
jgi:hypothetical protein